jgi:hypothetical protein
MLTRSNGSFACERARSCCPVHCTGNLICFYKCQTEFPGITGQRWSPPSGRYTAKITPSRRELPGFRVQANCSGRLEARGNRVPPFAQALVRACRQATCDRQYLISTWNLSGLWDQADSKVLDRLRRRRLRKTSVFRCFPTPPAGAAEPTSAGPGSFSSSPRICTRSVFPTFPTPDATPANQRQVDDLVD